MMIKEQVKALWEICFDDSGEFVEMYFGPRYKTEVSVAIQSGDEVISALQMLPYPMTFGGETVQTSYISGACTHPDFRSKGVIRELLSQSFTRMLRNGVHFSTLIPAEPWLFNYYARMRYASAFEYSTKEVVLSEFIPSKEIAVSVVSEFQEGVYSYLNRKLSEWARYIQYTSEDFQVIMTDLIISGGYLFVARQENEIKGTTIIYKGDKHIIINELYAENKNVEYSLLYAIWQHTGYKCMVQTLPPEEKQPQHPLGMVRIINAKEVLQIYAAVFPEDGAQLELSDKQLSVNNGYYYLCKGKCMYSTERLPGTHIQINISELTNRILQPLRPYMSLTLN